MRKHDFSNQNPGSENFILQTKNHVIVHRNTRAHFVAPTQVIFHFTNNENRAHIFLQIWQKATKLSAGQSPGNPIPIQTRVTESLNEVKSEKVEYCNCRRRSGFIESAKKSAKRVEVHHHHHQVQLRSHQNAMKSHQKREWNNTMVYNVTKMQLEVKLWKLFHALVSHVSSIWKICEQEVYAQV